MAPEVLNLYAFIKQVRGSTYFTNLFYLPHQINTLYEQGQCSIFIGNDLSVVLEKDGDLQRLYFCSRSKDLKEIPNLLAKQDFGTICCDVITQESAEVINQIFTSIGMQHYSTFLRLARKDIPNECEVELDDVELATTGDVDEIQLLLRSTFDSWTAHFPTDELVVHAIDKGDIFIIRKDGNIVALGYYDTESVQKTCLKYYIVRDGYRGQHLAEKVLYEKMLNHNKSHSYYLWIDENNKFGLVRHHKNKFVEDGLKDHIYKFM